MLQRLRHFILQPTHRRDRARFNCDTQSSDRWRQRTIVAGGLIEAVHRVTPLSMIADIGCGDCKLSAEIGRRGIDVAYRGFDLIPQSPDVEAFDIRTTQVPVRFDLAVALGVFEYIADPAAAIGNIQTPWFVVSHTCPVLNPGLLKSARRLNWCTFLPGPEFENILRISGYEIVEDSITPDHSTRVWLCRRGSSRREVS